MKKIVFAAVAAAFLATPALASFSAAIEPLMLSSRVEVIHPDHVDTL